MGADALEGRGKGLPTVPQLANVVQRRPMLVDSFGPALQFGVPEKERLDMGRPSRVKGCAGLSRTRRRKLMERMLATRARRLEPKVEEDEQEGHGSGRVGHAWSRKASPLILELRSL